MALLLLHKVVLLGVRAPQPRIQKDWRHTLDGANGGKQMVWIDGHPFWERILAIEFDDNIQQHVARIRSQNGCPSIHQNDTIICFLMPG